MTDLRLSLCVTDSPRTRPIVDGRVRAQGVDFTSTVLTPGDVFWRQLHFDEFDVSEMSMSSLLMVLAHGDRRWQALPVFTTREFFHRDGVMRVGAGIDRPEDLRGKRVGVTEYQQTAAVWARGALQHEFGVTPEEIDWYMERTPDRSHGGATGFTPPSGLRLSYIAPPETIGSLLLSGGLDACIRYSTFRSFVNRGSAELRDLPGVRTLFPDPLAEGVRYFRATSILPINHGLIVRRSLLEQHPWLALNIYSAFLEARDLARAEARESLDPYVKLGHSAPDILAVDPFPYGIQANRKTLEALAQYSHEQGLTPRVLSLDEIFAPSTLTT
jgi:4,5-dihydroxyphthalate decarboxylase